MTLNVTSDVQLKEEIGQMPHPHNCLRNPPEKPLSKEFKNPVSQIHILTLNSPYQ